MAVFCRKCGTEVPEGHGACSRCGSQNLIVPGNPQSSTGGPMVTPAPGASGGSAGPVLTGPRPATAPRAAPRGGGGKTSGMAIASLVLGLLGLLTCGSTSFIGLILGIAALSQLNNNPELEGRGIAVGGIVSSSVIIGLGVILAVILYPVFNMGRQIAYTGVCMANQQQIANALEMYVQDNEGKFPPADGNWTDLLRDYGPGGSSDTSRNPQNLWNCPATPRPGNGSNPEFGVNAALLGQPLNTVASPEQVLMIADSTSSSHQLKSTGDIDMVRHAWRKDKNDTMRKGVVGVYADGHAAFLVDGETVNLTVQRREPTPEPSPFGQPMFTPSYQPMPY